MSTSKSFVAAVRLELGALHKLDEWNLTVLSSLAISGILLGCLFRDPLMAGIGPAIASVIGALMAGVGLKTPNLLPVAVLASMTVTGIFGGLGMLLIRLF